MIETVDLHDTTLLGVRIDWESGDCVVGLRHARLGHCFLTFSAVTNLILPRKQSWGPSSLIQASGETGSGEYTIEMQSGDLIRIVADGVVLTVSEPV